MGGDRLHGHGEYLKVVRHYADLIDSGQLKPGDRLPTRPELQDEHGISNSTATKAINVLRQELYIRSSTRGTFVWLTRHDRLYQQLADLLNELEDGNQSLQFEEGQTGMCIAGRDGGVCWDPETQSWKKV